MEIVTIETPSLGDRSYLVHDGEVGLVVDPQRDVDRVLEAAVAAGVGAGVRITHVAETHVHNDYLSGGLVLARITGAECLHAAAEPVRFDHRGLADGDVVMVGGLEVEAVHTPGHTEHHLSYVVRRRGDDGVPPAVFTGGSLLHGAVGRTDLVAADLTELLTRAQYRSVRRLAARLPDEARIWPTHGFGGFCASVGSRPATDGTLGEERRANVAFTSGGEDEFVARLVAGLSAYPRYYVHMEPMNLAGAGPVDLSPPVTVDPVELARRVHQGDWVVDLRHRRAYAADHLSGSVSFELGDRFATYLGWLIPWGTPLTLLADSHEQLAEAQRQLARIGIDRPMGAATGEPALWAEPSRRCSYPVTDFAGVARAVAELAAAGVGSGSGSGSGGGAGAGGAGSGGQVVSAEVVADPVADALAGGVIVDVRRADERAQGAIEGSAHVPMHELNGHQAELPEGSLLVHCSSGARAAVAASLLDRGGHRVVLIDDDFVNAEAAGLTVIRPAPDGQRDNNTNPRHEPPSRRRATTERKLT